MPRASGPFITGKVGFIGVVDMGGAAPTVSLPATNITIAAKADVPEVSNVDSGGFVENVVGVRSAEITADCSYDPAQFGGFYAGQKVDVLILPTGNNPEDPPAEYPVSALSMVFPYCTITSVNYNVAVKDAQKVSLSIKSNGPYTFMTAP